MPLTELVCVALSSPDKATQTLCVALSGEDSMKSGRRTDE